METGPQRDCSQVFFTLLNPELQFFFKWDGNVLEDRERERKKKEFYHFGHFLKEQGRLSLELR